MEIIVISSQRHPSDRSYNSSHTILHISIGHVNNRGNNFNSKKAYMFECKIYMYRNQKKKIVKIRAPWPRSFLRDNSNRKCSLAVQMAECIFSAIWHLLYILRIFLQLSETVAVWTLGTYFIFHIQNMSRIKSEHI